MHGLSRFGYVIVPFASCSISNLSFELLFFYRLWNRFLVLEIKSHCTFNSISDLSHAFLKGFCIGAYPGEFINADDVIVRAAKKDINFSWVTPE